MTPPPASSGHPRDAGVAALKPAFKLCYREAVGRYASAGGTVKVGVRLAADGSVADAKILCSTTRPPSLGHCVRHAFEGGHFPPPPEGDDHFTVPVILRLPPH